MKSKRKTIYLLVVTLIAAMLAGCGPAQKGNSSGTDEVGKRKVIIDTDTGADDASALILAASSEEIEILGVTVLVGNVDMEQGVKNALMALEVGGSDAPVYKGSSENLSGEVIEAFSVFGNDGMGDADLIHPKGKAQDKDAIDFIIETVKKYPDEVEIIALGPATNVAKAIQKDPETMKKVKTIWSMGTAGLGPGNATPVAEFNVYADPEAYKYMLESGEDITVVGYDVTLGDALWTDNQFEKLSKSGDKGKFIADSFAKIREFYNANGSEGAVSNCDGLAMVCALDPDFILEDEQCLGSCIVDKGETYGQVLFYREGHTYDVADNDYDYNVRLVTEVDAANYFKSFLDGIK